MATQKELEILITARNRARKEVREAIGDMQALAKAAKAASQAMAGVGGTTGSNGVQNGARAQTAAILSASKAQTAAIQAAGKAQTAAITGQARIRTAAVTAAGKAQTAAIQASGAQQVAITRGNAQAQTAAMKAAGATQVAQTKANGAAQVAAMRATGAVQVAQTKAVSAQQIAHAKATSAQQIAQTKANSAQIVTAQKAQSAAQIAQIKATSAQALAVGKNLNAQQMAQIQAASRQAVAAQQSAAKTQVAATQAAAQQRLAVIKNTHAQEIQQTQMAARANIASEQNANRLRIAEMQNATRMYAATSKERIALANTAARQEATAARSAIAANRELTESTAHLSQRMSHLSQDLFFAGAAFSAAFTVPIVAAAKSILTFGSSYEDAFAQVRKTNFDASLSVADNEKSFAKLNDTIIKLSFSLPATREEIANIATIAGQLGVSQKDVAEFTETIIRMAESSNLSADQAADGMARLANVFAMPMDQIDNLGSTIAGLGIRFAATESDILNMSFRIAGAGIQAGLTNAEVIGLATGLSSLGVKAEMGGSAISRVLKDITKWAALGGEELEKVAAVAGVSADQFSAAWAENPREAFLQFIEGFARIGEEGADALTFLDDVALDGIRVSDVLMRASGNTDLLRRAMEESNPIWEENSELVRISEERFKTLSAQWQMAKNHLTLVAVVIYNRLRPALLIVVSAVARVGEQLVKLAGHLDKVPTPILVVIVALLGLLAAIGPVIIAFSMLAAAMTPASLAIAAIIGKIILGTAVLGGLMAAISPLSDFLSGAFTFAWVAARDAVLTFLSAFRGEWVNQSNVRRIHQWAGELGNFARGLKNVIKDIRQFGFISSGTMLMFDRRIRPAIQLANTFIHILTAGFRDIKGRVMPVLNALGTSFNRLAAAFQRGGLLAALRELPREVQRLARVLLDVLYEAFEDIVYELRQIDWWEVGASVVDGIVGALHFTADIATRVWNWVKGQVGEIDWIEVGTTIANGISAAWDFTVDIGTVVYNWIKEKVDGIDWSGIGSTLSSAIGLAWSFTTDIGSTIYDWIKRGVSAVTQTDWSNVAKTAASGIAAAWDMAVDIGTPVYDWISAQVGRVDWSGLPGDIKDAIVAAWDTSVDIGTPVYDWIAGQVGRIDWSGLPADIQTKIVDGWDATVDIATTVYNWITNQVGKVDWAGLASAIGTKIKDAWDTTIDIGSAIRDWVSAKIEGTDWKQVGTDLATNVKDGWDASVDIATTIKDWLSDQIDQIEWDKIAASISDGLDDAVEKSSDLYESGKKIAKRVEDGILDYDFEDAFDSWGDTIERSLSGSKFSGIGSAIEDVTKPLGHWIDMMKSPVWGTIRNSSLTLESLGRSFGNIGEALGKIVDAALDFDSFTSGVDGANPIIERAASAWAAWERPLGMVVKGVAALAGVSFIVIAEGFEAMSRGMLSFARGLELITEGLLIVSDPLGEFLNTVILGSLTQLEGMGNVLDALIVTPITVLSEIFDGNWGGAWDAFVDGMGTLAEGLGKLSTGNIEIMDGLIGFIGDLVGLMGGGAAETISDGWNAIKGMLEFFLQEKISVPDLTDVLTFIGDVINIFARVDELPDEVNWPTLGSLPIIGDSEAFGQAVDFVKGAFQKIQEIGETAWPSLNPLPSFGTYDTDFLSPVGLLVTAFGAIKELDDKIDWPSLNALPKFGEWFLKFAWPAGVIVTTFGTIDALVDSISWPSIPSLPDFPGWETFVTIVDTIVGAYNRLAGLAELNITLPAPSIPNVSVPEWVPFVGGADVPFTGGGGGGQRSFGGGAQPQSSGGKRSLNGLGAQGPQGMLASASFSEGQLIGGTSLKAMQSQVQSAEQYVELVREVVDLLGDAAASMGEDGARNVRDFAEAGKTAFEALLGAWEFLKEMGDESIDFSDQHLANMIELNHVLYRIVALMAQNAESINGDYLANGKLFAEGAEAGAGAFTAGLDLLTALGEDALTLTATHHTTLEAVNHLLYKAVLLMAQNAESLSGPMLESATELATATTSIVSAMSAVLTLLLELDNQTLMTGDRLTRVDSNLQLVATVAFLLVEHFQSAAVNFEPSEGADLMATAVGATVTAMTAVVDLILKLEEVSFRSVRLTNDVTAKIAQIAMQSRNIASVFATAAEGFEDANTDGVEPLTTTIESALAGMTATLDIIDLLLDRGTRIDTSLLLILRAVAGIAKRAVLIARTFALAAEGFEDVNVDGVEPLATNIEQAAGALTATVDLLNLMADNSAALDVSPERVLIAAKNLSKKARLIADAFREASDGWGVEVDPEIEALAANVESSTGAVSSVLGFLKELYDGPVKGLHVDPAKVLRRVEQLRDLAVEIANAFKAVEWSGTIDPEVEALSADVENSVGILTNMIDLINQLVEAATPKEDAPKISVAEEVTALLGQLRGVLLQVQAAAAEWEGSLGLIETFGVAVESVFTALETALSLSGEGGEVDFSGVSNIISGIIALFQTDLFLKLLDLIAEWAPRLKDSGIYMGESLGFGVATGLSNSYDEIMAVVESIATGIEARFQAAMEIASPSRVMTRHGYATGLGIARGLDQSEGAVTNSVEHLAKLIGPIFAREANPKVGLPGFNGLPAPTAATAMTDIQKTLAGAQAFQPGGEGPVAMQLFRATTGKNPFDADDTLSSEFESWVKDMRELNLIAQDTLQMSKEWHLSTGKFVEVSGKLLNISGFSAEKQAALLKRYGPNQMTPRFASSGSIPSGAVMGDYVEANRRVEQREIDRRLTSQRQMEDRQSNRPGGERGKSAPLNVTVEAYGRKTERVQIDRDNGRMRRRY